MYSLKNKTQSIIIFMLLISSLILGCNSTENSADKAQNSRDALSAQNFSQKPKTEGVPMKEIKSYDAAPQMTIDTNKELYYAKIELEKGCNPSLAVSNAIEAANNVLLDSGCPNDICDALASAAIKGFTNYMNNHPNGDPMEAFDAAGESVNEVLESEFKNFDK